MAKLNSLIDKLDIKGEFSSKIEIKHFFSGAALYINIKHMRIMVGHRASIQTW